MWFVYVLVSATGRTYVGSTVDVARRLRQHNGLAPGGARATRAGRPWRVGRVVGPLASRGQALALEHRLKRSRGRRRLTVGFGPGLA
ncbi:MAG: GIY-YIG nuclease family protein [Myxococcales bacterium]|nr:GIY-YIG nuclease family protein [Myxococcales bacterium]